MNNIYVYSTEIKIKVITFTELCFVLIRNCDRLDVMIFKLPASERQSARMRIDQLKYDVRHLQSSLQLYRDKRKRQKIEQQEREQLLSRRFVPNSNETCLDMDYALQHHDQLSSAHRGIDDLLATGGSILGSLIDQRSTLKNAKQRLMTIGSTLGLSNHTMKMIERRLSEDKYIMFGGMFGTLVIIVIVVYFIVL